MQPEQTLQVHAQDAHVPSGGGQVQEFQGEVSWGSEQQKIKRCPCCVCGGVCEEWAKAEQEPRPFDG